MLTETELEAPQLSLSFQPVLDVLLERTEDADDSFEQVIEAWLPELMEAEQTFLEELAEEDMSVNCYVFRLSQVCKLT